MCKQTVISDTDGGNGDADIAAPSANPQVLDYFC